MRIVVRMGKHHVIALDLDGTAAHYEGWVGDGHIGPPVPGVIVRVKRALAAGHSVWIYTARVAVEDDHGGAAEAAFQRGKIEEWCLEHIGVVLPITATKLRRFSEFWDDKAIRIGKNTGALGHVPTDALWRQLSDPGTIDAPPALCPPPAPKSPAEEAHDQAARAYRQYVERDPRD